MDQPPVSLPMAEMRTSLPVTERVCGFGVVFCAKAHAAAKGRKKAKVARSFWVFIMGCQLNRSMQHHLIS